MCAKGFSGMTEVENHMKTHCNLEKSDIFCIVCTHMFKSELELEWHIETHHDGNFKCLACDVCYNSQDELGVHIVISVSIGVS